MIKQSYYRTELKKDNQRKTNSLKKLSIIGERFKCSNTNLAYLSELCCWKCDRCSKWSKSMYSWGQLYVYLSDDEFVCGARDFCLPKGEERERINGTVWELLESFREILWHETNIKKRSAIMVISFLLAKNFVCLVIANMIDLYWVYKRTNLYEKQNIPSVY